MTMKLTIHLERVGISRVGPDAIPIAARVLQGNKFGENIMQGLDLVDVETVKKIVEDKMKTRYGGTVAINWIDKTVREGAE